jgi:REP element-mobilizing transposase RayT
MLYFNYQGDRSMPHHPRIETKDYAAFTTTRTKHSELWFINNKPFEEKILAFIAKYSEEYHVKLYALAIEGSHIHHFGDYPEENCSAFHQALNSMIARIAPQYCVKYHNYKFWERRYSKELIPHHHDDLIAKFLYTVLQPVQDGLIERISDYPGYTCLSDAIKGIDRKFELVNWTSYNRALRTNEKESIQDHTEEYTLKFHRIPGLEHLSDKEYQKHMFKKVEERRLELVNERREEGLGFVGKENLKNTELGTSARSPKKSTRYSFRPRVDSVCPERKQEAKNFYFRMYDLFKKASAKYRKGYLNVEFPPGMYRPHLSTCLTHPPSVTQ